jgi:formylglycine-generating enzyme required for sulfatase activity
MKATAWLLMIGAVVQLAVCGPAAAYIASDRIELTIDVAVQSGAGTTQIHCRESGVVEGYAKKEWWLAVPAPAVAAPEPGQNSGMVVACGAGERQGTPADSMDDGQAPELNAEITTVTRLNRKGEDERNLEMDVSISLLKRSGLEESGQPAYTSTELRRTLYFSDDSFAIVPLRMADPQEDARSESYEVYLRISATAIPGREASSLGALLVSSDMEEAELFLDGGLVGNITAGQEITLRNVKPGVRLLEARDAAGEEIRKAVRVMSNRTVPVNLSRADAGRSPGAFRLTALGPNAEGFEEYRRQVDDAVVVRVPAGEFLMGNEDTERSPLEHTVYVSEFLMDKTGVTWRQFKQFAAATGAPLPPAEPYWGFPGDHPAVFVTWVEAKNYCEWAGGRLPTEAEREKAARGTDERKFPWGDDEPEPDLAVFRKSWGFHSTAPVGAHPAGASPYGLLDMGGNVWEWCADWYDGDYYSNSPFRNPRGPATGNAHVVRGGSWDSRPSVLSASCRSWGHLGYRDGDFGFRCAMNAP